MFCFGGFRVCFFFCVVWVFFLFCFVGFFWGVGGLGF